MVVASLLPYRRGLSRVALSAVLAVMLLGVLFLLGCAVFAGNLMSDPMPDGPLVAPFRWWTATDIA